MTYDTPIAHGRSAAESGAGTGSAAPVFTGSYRTLWGFLLVGWVISYADRTVTGPVVAWMIANKAGFIGDAAHPAALGGLVGSVFFTGYMLTQYAGGRLGDRYGHREMLVVSLLWAGVLTLVSGMVTGLVAFVAARVLTGVGEGVFYSNDRTMIMNHTPPAKREFGLGVVLTGLSIGLTLGLLATPYLIHWGLGALGDEAWRVPMWTLGVLSLIVAGMSWWYFHKSGAPLRILRSLRALVTFAVPLASVIFLLFVAAERLSWPDWLTAVACGGLALGVIVYVVASIRRAGDAEALLNRNMWIMYLSFVAVMWNLWFFSFWSVQIVKEAAQSSLVAAGLTAAFNAGAGIIGFPVGGWIAARQVRRGRGRKPLAIVCAIMHTALAVVFGFSVASGRPSLVLLALALFASGLFFNALQPIVHSILGDLVPESGRGSAFGLFNLVAEIGAVASPVVSGVLRDITGSWAPGVFTAAGVMACSIIGYCLVRERQPN